MDLDEKLSLRLSASAKAQLTILAEARGRTISQVARELLEQAIAREGDAPDLPALLHALHRRQAGRG